MNGKITGLHYTNISLVQWDLTNEEETSAVFAAISWCTAGHDDSLILRQGRWLKR